MIERIEALCYRLNDDNLWGLDSDDENLEEARQLIPLMLEVVKDGKDISGLALRGIEPLDEHLAALEFYCAKNLPEPKP